MSRLGYSGCCDTSCWNRKSVIGVGAKSADEWPPFAKMAEFESAVADLSSHELLEKVMRILNERRDELSGIR